MEGDTSTATAAEDSLSASLLRWQSASPNSSFEAISERAAIIAGDVAGAVLRKRGIRDPMAKDEAVSLVLTHLWRLRENRGKVTPFRISRGGNSAEAYIRWLTIRRSMDVARRLRRRSVKEVPLTEAKDMAVAGSQADGVCVARQELLERFHTLVGLLDRRSQGVMRRLVDGASQKEIAYELGVCEGTVSRIRAKAVQQMSKFAEASQGAV
jgi:RNA polymerase sigma factor (sigma-70 family)